MQSSHLCMHSHYKACNMLCALFTVSWHHSWQYHKLWLCKLDSFATVPKYKWGQSNLAKAVSNAPHTLYIFVAIPEIYRRLQKVKLGHVSPTRPLMTWFCIVFVRAPPSVHMQNFKSWAILEICSRSTIVKNFSQLPLPGGGIRTSV